MLLVRVRLKQGPGFSLLLLHTLTWAWTGAIERPPKIDGQHRSVVTLQENKTRQFRCQVDSWSPDAPTLLTWYLNGEKQSQPRDEGSVRPAAKSRKQSRVLKQDPQRNSTLSLRARKWDRELVCVASNPQSGESYNATVTLNVQFQPEILRVDAHYSETSDPGLSLVLFALVRSNPPATITWIDQSGHPVANASDFLILDSQNYPWLLAGNVSVNASNSIGAAQTNLTLSEFLQSRVEVPVLGIVTGGCWGKGKDLFSNYILYMIIFLCFCVSFSNESPKVQIDSVYLPRENMSLPSTCRSQQNPGEKKADEEEEDLSLVYAARGFARYPMVGYIYKVNSVSSDEIWL
uniref:Ig-like domain-containing protein n=1 Tax=Denticeps clupeoides TaxID=299321 RepID=A0AAY4EEP6_9TELE